MASQKQPLPGERVEWRVKRRTFLADAGMGFTRLALGAILAGDGVVRGESPEAQSTETWSPPDGRPHLEPKAKSVI